MQRTKVVLALIVFLTGFAVGFDIRDPVPSILTPESPLYASKLVEEERQINSAAIPVKRLAIYDKQIMFRINEMDAVLRKGKPDYLNCLCMSYYRTLRRNGTDLRTMYVKGKLPRETALEMQENLKAGVEKLVVIEDKAAGESRTQLKITIKRTESAIADIDRMMKGTQVEKIVSDYN
ncbi:MAG: hypothetical protein PHT33_06350 [bacterium]|nr:hypothetical protein [bacterium]